MKIRVSITLKKSVLDPQGAAIAKTLADMGFTDIDLVRQGKIVDLDLEGAEEQALEKARKISDSLLVNHVIEDYELTILGA